MKTAINLFIACILASLVIASFIFLKVLWLLIGIGVVVYICYILFSKPIYNYFKQLFKTKNK